MNFIKRILGGQKSGAEYERTYVAISPQEKAHAELQRDIALAGLSENNPVWQAVLHIVDEAAHGELEGALAPNLTDSQRQYTAGCAATADYIAQKLRDARLLASQKVKAKKTGE